MKRLTRIFALLISLALCAAFPAACGSDSDPGKTDLSDFPLYEENFQTMKYSEEAYKEHMSAPYWKGNVMYNELTLPISYAESGEAYAKLLYKPLKVISVMDQTLGKTYQEGADYTVDAANGRLIIPEGSSIPLLNEKAFTGETVEEIVAAAPEGFNYEGSLSTGAVMPSDFSSYVIWDSGMLRPFVYTESPFFYGRYLSVTYAYDVSELPEDLFAKYDVTIFSGLRSKLESGQDISLAVLGDSISEGSSSTGDNLHVAPYTPCYAKQLQAEISRVYGVNVTLTNAAKGGTRSEYPLVGDGIAALQSVLDAQPDLCVIAYGMNDAPSDVTPIEYKNNILETVLKVKAAAPDCCIVLVNSFPCNPLDIRTDGKFEAFREQLENIAAEYKDGTVTVVDMFSVGNYFMQTKAFCEISSSNNNHPNDFMHRVYAMNIMSVLCDYKS